MSKPKLKVGDYAEVTQPFAICDTGKIVVITEVISNFIVKVRHIIDGYESLYSMTRLEKIQTPVTEWAILPVLSNLDQYRLALEIYLDMLKMYRIESSIPMFEAIRTHLLTEILEA